jgi:hypothetical protein
MSCKTRHFNVLRYFVTQNNKMIEFGNIPQKGFFVFLLALSLPFFLIAQQQTLIIPVDSTLSQVTLINCDTNTHFISDVSNHNLYADTANRSDTMSICPPSQGQRIKIYFNAFDLAAGDTLFAYDGKYPNAANFRGSGSGVGPSKAFGAWIAASCAPAANPSGCLSFIFKTNGDKITSNGWKAKIRCESKNIQIHKPSIPSQLSNCSPAYGIVKIPSALVTGCNPVDTFENDTTFVRVYNTLKEICIDTFLSNNKNESFTDTFAFGTYLVEYKLKSDTSIHQHTSFSVEPRALVCNDTLNIGLDYSCASKITPDVLLEAPCDTLADTMYYKITILAPDDKLPEGRVIASGTSRSGNFPVITKDMVDFCGKTVYRAKIQRIYYDSLNLSFCNNGTQINTCWSYLRFEDKASPVFLDPVQCDTIFACDAEMTPAALGLDTPKVKDNCDSVKIVFYEIIEVSPPSVCAPIQKYLAVWHAYDQCGNRSERQDTIKLIRPGIDKIIKAPDAILSCGIDDTTALHDYSRLGVPSIQTGRQKNGVFLPKDTIPLTLYAKICNYNLEKTDVLVSTECNEKYYRYWNLLDWCATPMVPVAIDTQLVEFKDTIAPVINCPKYTSLATAEHLPLSADACQMKVHFPLPTAIDNCVKEVTVVDFTVEVLEDSVWWPIATTLEKAGALQCDTFRVGYRAFDDCHEQLKEDTCYRYFIIEDVTAPTAICEDKLHVGLTTGVTHIHADAIDGGSWDQCQVDTILVRRTKCNDISTYLGQENAYVKTVLGNRIDLIGWTDVLEFSCCDVHHPVFVELLVIDKKGNFNTCWMEVKPEDKLAPICQPLPPATAFCDQYSNLELGSETDLNENNSFDENEWLPLAGALADFYNQQFGDPLLACEDNLTCNDLMLEQEYQLIRQSCGEASIKRRYRVIDYGKNHSAWEEQLIHLTYRPNWQLRFPIDQKGQCGSRQMEPAVSPIQNGNCDQLSWDYEDEVFETSNSVFVKVLRTFSIINWCIYNPGDKPLIISRNENNEGLVTQPLHLDSDSLQNVSYIKYVQALRVIDEDAPFLTLKEIDTLILGKGDVFPHGEEDQTLGAAPFECDEVKVFQVFARDCDEANTESLRYEWAFYMNGALISQGTGDTFSQIVYPGPKYEVKWQATDLFANTSVIEKAYIFTDGLAPVAYCNNGIVAETNPDQRFVRVDVDLFDRGSYDNCTDQSKLKKRLWHPVLNIPRPQTMMEVMALPTYLEFGCLFIGTQEVSFYVMDEAGNFDYCTTFLIIQNNMLSCSRRNISGEIKDRKDRPIEQVAINVTSTDNNLSLSSSAKGHYEFTMPDGADYTIRPFLDKDHLNGVSTYDLVLINQHILGVKEFSSPYQYIAADVNLSGTITAFDIVQIRQLILNIIPRFPNNTSWRFIDMDQPINSKYSALQMKASHEEKTIRDLSGDRLGMDFLGIKIGDIDGSAVPNQSAVANGRQHKGKMRLAIDNQTLKKGEIFSVPFQAINLDEITGCQFTLQFKNLKLLNIEGGIIGLENFGQSQEAKGILTTSWHHLQSHVANSTLFVLTFQSATNGT